MDTENGQFYGNFIVSTSFDIFDEQDLLLFIDPHYVFRLVESFL